LLCAGGFSPRAGSGGITSVFATLASRIVYFAAVLLAVVTVVFAMLRLSGDPLDALAPPGSAPEDVEALRQKYGLDEPVAVQYVRFVTEAARGDFGDSWRFDRPALGVVLDRFPATLELVGASLALALLVAVPLGALAGARPGGGAAGASHAIALLGQAVPGFWLGTLLILLFAVRLDWLPSSGRDGVAGLVLPVVTLAAFPMAMLIRLIRASVQEAMRLDHVRTARAKGLPERMVLAGHVLRVAAGPAIAYAGLVAGFLVTGSVVVESVFAYPGAGQLALQSVTGRDLPVVLAFVSLAALFVVLANLIADLVAMLVDPRLRSSRDRMEVFA
jgi:peptide/nickel transport system permease protein